MKYQIISIVIVILGGNTISQSCTTCLARLPAKDQPFFIRHISAQIVTAQTISSKEKPASKEAKKEEKKVTSDKTTR
jgi:hypothetical protein